MLVYLLRRFVFAVLLVFTVSSAALILVRLAPGDFADTTAVPGTSREVKDAMRARLGLNRSVARQYGAWVADAVRLDFGNSMMYGSPVRGLVRDGAVNTAILAATALAAATLIGLPLGVISGSRRGALADVIRSASIVLLSLPPLLSSLVLLAIAASTRWLPVGDMRSAGGTSWPLIDLLHHLIVPATALALPIAAMFERMQSQAMAEVVAQPYVLAALARGIPRSRIIWRDALKPALRPAAAVYGLVVGALLSGSFAVEAVTSWPGLGVLMLDALRARDLYLVAGCAAAGSAFLAIGTIMSDVALVLVDPRAVEAG
jgi:peptide/nickel transport system permease protein